MRRRAFSVSIALLLLGGCGGPQSPTGGTALPQAPATSAHVIGNGSWMLPEASSEDLLYVTNYSDVLVYSYPQGKLVGTLRGFYSAAGECVDSKGDVFITNFKPVTVYEYAHGGTKRIASFPTKKAGTVGCAIDPTTGDLAISGDTSYLEIYKRGAHKPIVLQDKRMWFGGFCTYDDNGDLFFFGLKDPQGHNRLSELPARSTKFAGIRIPWRILDGEDSIQWDGRYLTALAYVPFRARRKNPEIIRFKVNGVHLTRVGETLLKKPAAIIVQYYVDKGTVVVPSLPLKVGPSATVLLYDYPAGGKPYLTLTKRISDPRGVVVSRAPR